MRTSLLFLNGNHSFLAIFRICRSLEDSKRELADLNIVADVFKDRIQFVTLRWICSGKTGSEVAEMTAPVYISMKMT